MCEIGGGRDPLFNADITRQLGLSYTINDIEQSELDLAPAEFEKACFDISGDLSKLPAKHGPGDLMVSRMVFEHLADAEQAWHNVRALLAPGDVALSFFPTLYAWLFALNHVIPERLSHSIVRALVPNRRDGGGDPKFPVLGNVHAGLDALFARMDWRLFTSYAYVFVRK